MNTTEGSTAMRRTDVMRELGISPSTFRRWVQQGRLELLDTGRPGVWVTGASVESMREPK